MLAAMGLIDHANAVVTVTTQLLNLSQTRDVTLRVGSPGSIDIVTFNVANANVSPNPVAVAGVSNGPATTPANGTQILITADVPFATSVNVSLNVDSSAGLSCVGGSGCGSTVIPFSTISWTSSNLATGGFAGQDIQNGSFNGSATQTIAQIPVFALLSYSNVVMSNVLNFTYANASLFPAGQYRGRVVFTASVL